MPDVLGDAPPNKGDALLNPGIAWTTWISDRALNAVKAAMQKSRLQRIQCVRV